MTTHDATALLALHEALRAIELAHATVTKLGDEALAIRIFGIGEEVHRVMREMSEQRRVA